MYIKKKYLKKCENSFCLRRLLKMFHVTKLIYFINLFIKKPAIYFEKLYRFFYIDLNGGIKFSRAQRILRRVYKSIQ